MAGQTTATEAGSGGSEIIGSNISSAESAIDAAFQAIEGMTGAAGTPAPFIDFFTPYVGISVPSISGTGPSRPDTALADIKSRLGTSPDEFTASVSERVTREAPQETFTTPVIAFPTAPTFNVLTKPSAQTITLPDDIPDVPALTIPDTLSVGGQTIPSVPGIETPAWGENLPTFDITLPDTNFAYVEPAYISALKTAINSGLITNINNGGTGYGESVETDIWNNDIERLNQKKDDDIEDLMGSWGGRGFDLPSGVIASTVNDIQKAFSEERAKVSKQIAIEQINIAKDMTQFFLSTGLTLEQIELSFFNNINNRALEAQKLVVQFSIDLFNTKVSGYNAQLARYQSKGAEVEARLKIQALILDGYRAELSSIELQDQIDRTAIDNYRAILASHDASIRLYEAEVNAKIAELNIEKGKIDIFRSQIDGYVAEISAQQSEYELYKSRISGELAKIELHKTEVEAYAQRVRAVKVTNDVVIEKIKSDIAIEDMQLRAHLGNVDVYQAKTQNAISEMGTEIDFFKADAGAYQFLVDFAQRSAELNVQTQIRTGLLNQQSAAMSLEAAIAGLNAASQANSVRLSASISKAIASSSMAGMIGASIQGLAQKVGTGYEIETKSSSA